MTREEFDKFVAALVEDDVTLSGVEYLLRFLPKYTVGISQEVFDRIYNEMRRAVELAKARKKGV